DQRMPGIQGTEVLARSVEVYPLARRVMLTAYSDIDAAIKAINQAHLHHYLSKPWDPPEECLFPVIDDLLDAWQAEDLPESEGLRTLLLDRHAPGGQAGCSSRIDNYLGFPAGVSGSELTRRAVTQAQRLGAEMLVPLEVSGVSIDAGYKHLTLSDGREIVTRTMLAATGMAYREHPAPGVSEHTGAGVYYGTVTTEAPAFAGRRVVVVGGGNSAGQAAMHLARYDRDVHIVARRESQVDTISQYRIELI